MPMEKKDVCLTLENVSKVFARVESDEVTHALQDVSPRSSALWRGSFRRRSAASP